LASERYHVATCSGYLSAKIPHGSMAPGVSAYVVDRLNASHVVKTFRSEDRLVERRDDGRIIRSPTRGQYGAIAAAEALAAEMNEAEQRSPQER
jgi:hypothetical protein